MFLLGKEEHQPLDFHKNRCFYSCCRQDEGEGRLRTCFRVICEPPYLGDRNQAGFPLSNL